MARPLPELLKDLQDLVQELEAFLDLDQAAPLSNLLEPRVPGPLDNAENSYQQYLDCKAERGKEHPALSWVPQFQKFEDAIAAGFFPDNSLASYSSFLVYNGYGVSTPGYGEWVQAGLQPFARWHAWQRAWEHPGQA